MITLTWLFWLWVADPNQEPELDEVDDPVVDDLTSDDVPDNTGAPDSVADLADDRLAAVERSAQEAQTKLEQVLRQAQQRPDPTLDEEERKLRDPATSDLERWQIQSNRALRASQMQSQQALFQAQDMADKTTFQVKAASNPLYKKYADKVEAELAKARSTGGNPPRDFVLQVLVGRDILAGNFKPAATKSTGIARGKPTGARSDTPSRSGMTEHQKRAARLENQQI